MFRLTSNEKAVLGGLAAFLVATIIQLQQSGQLTAHELLLSLGAFVVTHLTVWLTTNSSKPPVVPPIIPPAA